MKRWSSISAVATAALAAACATSSSPSTATTVASPRTASIVVSTATPSPPLASTVSAPASTSAAVDPLVAEARSAAAGDIPDNQVFLTFADAAAGYSIRYPEGWAQTGSGNDVTIRDRTTVLHVVVGAGAPPTAASVAADLAGLAQASPTLTVTAAPVSVSAGGQRAIKAVYETVSDPSPVTGKRVTLVVDRYVLAHGGRVMVVDLGSQKGVDNVDAFRLMIGSVRWTS